MYKNVLCNPVVPCHCNYRPIWFQAICVVAFPKILGLAVFRIFTKIGITLFPIPELVQDIQNCNFCVKKFSKSKSHGIIRPWGQGYRWIMMVHCLKWCSHKSNIMSLGEKITSRSCGGHNGFSIWSKILNSIEDHTWDQLHMIWL